MTASPPLGRYTAYAIVYYAENHKTIIQRRIKSQEADMKEDPEYWPWVMPAQVLLSSPEVHDLPYWIKRGKLQ